MCGAIDSKQVTECVMGVWDGEFSVVFRTSLGIESQHNDLGESRVKVGGGDCLIRLVSHPSIEAVRC